MKYLHTMIRITNIDESMDFFCNKLGLIEIRRKDVPEGKFTLIFLAADEDENRAINERAPEIELTYNWDPESYDVGRNFGHLAFTVKNIYEFCKSGIIKGFTQRKSKLVYDAIPPIDEILDGWKQIKQ